MVQQVELPPLSFALPDQHVVPAPGRRPEGAALVTWAKTTDANRQSTFKLDTRKTMKKYLLSLLVSVPLVGGGMLITMEEGHAGPNDRRERKQDVRSDRREVKQDVRSDRREVKQDVRSERQEHYERHETASDIARTAVAVGAAAAIVDAAND